MCIRDRNNTLNKAFTKSHKQASFVLSAGDQIQTNAKKVKNQTISEKEYTGYLCPEILQSLPVATTVGNHDADNPNYTYPVSYTHLDVYKRQSLYWKGDTTV